MTVTIHNGGGDVGKRWYLTWYDAQGVRHVKAISTKLRTCEERMAEAERMKREIEGGGGAGVAGQDRGEVAALLRRLWAALEERKVGLREDSGRQYRYMLLSFDTWLRERGGVMDAAAAGEYVRHLRESRTAVTVKHHILALRSIWRQAMGKAGNPWDGVRTERGTSTPARYFPESLRGQMKAWMVANDPQLWQVCQLIYYTGIRITECTRLKVADVILEGRQVRVSAAQAKTKIYRTPRIPEAFACVISGWGLDRYAPGAWLIGRWKEPGSDSITPNALHDRHRLALEACGLVDQGYTLYSWRHTWAVDAYRQAVPLKAIQRQLGHTTLMMTDRYLRQLVGEDFAEIRDFPGM